MDEAAAQLTARYDRESHAYRELWAPILRMASAPLLSRFGIGAGDRVLDVGAGVGTLARHLAETAPGAVVLGVDRSRGMLAQAPESLPRAVMDAQHLGVASNSVDRVLMIFMLFHLASPLDALREARRTLRARGRLGAVTWGGEMDSGAIRAWNDSLDACGAPTVEPAPTNRDLVDQPDKMEDLLRSAGFATVRAWTAPFTHRIEADHMIRLRSSMGSLKPRFDALPVEDQQHCVALARSRMAALAPEDFVTRSRIVYSIASV